MDIESKLDLVKEVGEEILTESVLSVFYQNKWLWIGTVDGIGIINSENDITTTIHRFWESTIYKDNNNMLTAYPNPFLINVNNQVDNDGYVRFLYSNPYDYKGTVDIYDFAMDKIIQLDSPHNINNESEVIWNGRNENGAKVANGVYFCRLFMDGKYFWTKLAVVN